MSTLIATTDLPLSEWTQPIPSARLREALLDRATKRAHIIETGSDSFPEDPGKTQKEGVRGSGAPQNFRTEQFVACRVAVEHSPSNKLGRKGAVKRVSREVRAQEAAITCPLVLAKS